LSLNKKELCSSGCVDVGSGITVVFFPGTAFQECTPDFTQSAALDNNGELPCIGTDR